jgi:hypothetical protein
MGGVFSSDLGDDISHVAALVANVTEPADIALFAFLLVTTLTVGLVLLCVDAVVRRIRLRAPPRERRPDDGAAGSSRRRFRR